MRKTSTRFNFRILASSVLLWTASSCSFVERNTAGLFLDKPAEISGEAPAPASQSAPPATEKQEARTQVRKLEKIRAEPFSRVEVLWALGGESVDYFILRYGYAPDNLSSELKLSARDTEHYEEPERGTVYRYVLEKMPKEKTIFMTLTSVKGDQSSSPTQLIEIKPRQ